VEPLQPRPELSARRARRLLARARRKQARADHWHARAEAITEQLANATSDRETTRHGQRLLGVQRLYVKESERFAALMDQLYGPGWEDRAAPG
jgi:hypothetical protein